MTETADKEKQLQALLAERRLDGVVLSRVSSFAWATAGVPSYVSTVGDVGEAQLLVTPDGSTVLTNDIEAPRLGEELGLATRGFRFDVRPWAEPLQLPSGLRLGSDLVKPSMVDLVQDVARLRTTLCAAEIARFTELGKRCAEAMAEAVRSVKPGQREIEIAAAMCAALIARDVWPAVAQIASDERVLAYRHVLPTEKRLDRYAFLSFCGRRDGLVCSMTRLVHFGRLPDELRRKQEVCARVDNAFLAATRPGTRASDAFAAACRAYAEGGFPDEWRKHHQGGAAGYEPREWVASPTSTEVIGDRQAFAWNPTVQGTKSEDTVILDGTVRVITQMPDWPQIEGRPAILEVT